MLAFLLKPSSFRWTLNLPNKTTAIGLMILPLGKQSRVFLSSLNFAIKESLLYIDLELLLL